MMVHGDPKFATSESIDDLMTGGTVTDNSVTALSIASTTSLAVNRFGKSCHW